VSERVAVLVNPAAGRGRAMRTVAQVLRRLRDAGVDARPVIGVDAADALDRARRAVDGGPRALVAVGGDGTVHLAGNAVAGTDVPLAIVPVGTGNDAARSLDVPMAPDAATDEIIRALGERRRARHRRGEGWLAVVRRRPRRRVRRARQRAGQPHALAARTAALRRRDARRDSASSRRSPVRPRARR
jgi:diacylglycerol kinase (ATP)